MAASGTAVAAQGAWAGRRETVVSAGLEAEAAVRVEDEEDAAASRTEPPFEFVKTSFNQGDVLMGSQGESSTEEFEQDDGQEGGEAPNPPSDEAFVGRRRYFGCWKVQKSSEMWSNVASGWLDASRLDVPFCAERCAAAKKKKSEIEYAFVECPRQLHTDGRLHVSCWCVTEQGLALSDPMDSEDLPRLCQRRPAPPELCAEEGWAYKIAAD